MLTPEESLLPVSNWFQQMLLMGNETEMELVWKEKRWILENCFTHQEEHSAGQAWGLCCRRTVREWLHWRREMRSALITIPVLFPLTGLSRWQIQMVIRDGWTKLKKVRTSLNLSSGTECAGIVCYWHWNCSSRTWCSASPFTPSVAPTFGWWLSPFWKTTLKICTCLHGRNCGRMNAIIYIGKI